MWEDTGTKMSPTLLQQQNRDLNYAMSRNSVSITHTKGLLNGPGQNNCFLNSAVQVLWHLDIFRRSFRELTGHACMADSCIFCALKELFAQFQYSHESALPPDALRRALAETFFNQQRFQLGFMDDAAECFENILLRIHSHIANMESEDMCNAPHCISHQKFAMTLVEQSVCHACGATSEPLSFTQMVHYVSASALCAQAKQAWDEGATVFPEFGQLLRKAGGMGDMRHCPSACGAKIQICRSLMNRPEIVSIGIVWDSERPTLDHIMNVFSTIRTTIKLQDMFHSVVDSRWAASSVHQLVGVVTYYGKHYSTFFFHTKLRVWIYFDDATVREIGPRWDQVVEKCHRGHFQPLLLLYAHPHGTPISLESAPQVITYINGHKRTSGPNKVDAGRGVYDPESNRTKPNLMNPVHRRAVTPNPESNYDTKEIQPRRAITPNPDPHIHANGGKSNSLPNTLQHASVKQSAYETNHSPNQDVTKDCSAVGNGLYGHLNYNSENPRSAPATMTVAEAKGNWRSVNEEQSKSHVAQADDLHMASRRGNNEPDSVFKFPPPKSLLEEVKLPLNPETERLIRDVDGIYISRKAVESVLNYQKLQRQRSLGGSSGYNSSTIGNRNSNSSIESFETGLRNRNQMSNYPAEMKAEGIDAANLPRRRDSGNWSGDRNSASSSSSVSLDNPYMHVVTGKRPFTTNRNSQMKTSDFSGNPMYDPGYDSYSLSSNDSFPLSPIAKHSQQLAQIPENPIKAGEIRMHSSTNSIDDCERLCIEADHFLEKSKEMEDTGDFLGAISLCNGAAAKARAAMDAPYTNPQSITFARMKHNTCVMRARSLHRRYLMRQESLNSQGSTTSTETDNSDSNKSENVMEGRHSRQSSADRTRRGESSHSRQSSRDNTSHSRQSSRDSTHKKIANIEIYATLPKKNSKKKLEKFDKIKTGSVRAKDEHILLQNHEKHKELVSFAEEKRVMKLTEISKDEKLKIKRKEDRKPKGDTDFSDYASEWELTRKPNLHRTYSGPACLRDLTSSQSYTDLSKVKPDPPKPVNPGKKQHKIRRKLLMGGLIRRKNRSMPDLREGQDGSEKSGEPAAFDDLQKGPFVEGNLTGYLSDAHLDSVQHRFPDQSLQRQVLYGSQRQLHSSQGKIPPQPPVRTTSQLSSRSQIASAAQKASFHPLLVEQNGTYPPGKQTNNYHSIKSQKSNSAHHVMPSKLHSPPQIVVQAEVHHERTPSDNIRPVSHKHPQDSNFGISKDPTPLSPKAMMVHYEKQSSEVPENNCHQIKMPSAVRNANFTSENKSAIEPVCSVPASVSVDSSGRSVDTDEDLPKGSGLLAELQAKRKQILKAKTGSENSRIVDNQKTTNSLPVSSSTASSTNGSCGWLQELQAKQMMLQQRKTSQEGKQQPAPTVNKPVTSEVTQMHVKQYGVVPNLKSNPMNNKLSIGKINQEETETDARPKSVKDLASKFEKIVSPVLPKKNIDSANPRDNHLNGSVPTPNFTQNSSLYSLPNPQPDVSSSKKPACVPSKFSSNNGRGSEVYFKVNNSQVKNESALDHKICSNDDSNSSLLRSSGSFSNSIENRAQHGVLHNGEYRQKLHNNSPGVPFNNSHNHVEPSVWQQKEQHAFMQQPNAPMNYGKSHQDGTDIPADTVDLGSRNTTINASKPYQLHNHYYPQSTSDSSNPIKPRDCMDGINVNSNSINSTRLATRTPDNQMKTDIPHYVTKSLDQSVADHYKNPIRQTNSRLDPRIDSVGIQNGEANGNKTMAPVQAEILKQLDCDSSLQNSSTCNRKKKTGKKSVTFSDQIALVASADDGSEDYIPNPLLERVYKTVAMQKTQPPKPAIQNTVHKHSTVSTVQPVAHSHIPASVCCDPPGPQVINKLKCSPNKVPCHLCRKKSVLPPTVYCPDCDFYMSRFKPK